MFEDLCNVNPDCQKNVMRSVLTLAVELAREGREGRHIGTIFVVGDEQAVMDMSRPMILDPIYGHDMALRDIRSTDLRETLKELAQLDGAFVISNDGFVMAACRYLDAPAQGLSLPLGLGSRHVSSAAITRATRAAAVVVSSSAIVRLFYGGEMMAEIVPELFLLSREMTHLQGPVEERDYAGVKVFKRRDV